TTVVETNIHYPTDATLLADGVRVLTRTLRRGGGQGGGRGGRVARPAVAVAQRRPAGRGRAGGAGRGARKAERKNPPQRLLRITRAVVRHADATARRVRDRRAAAQLVAMSELVRQVVAQTRARVLRGNTHYPDKVVSLFEPHTDIIRKGKLAHPTEFGRLV